MAVESMPELKDIVVLLKGCRLFKSRFQHINENRILYTSYTKKNSRIHAKIGGIPKRFEATLTDYDYFLEVNKENWLAASEGKRLYIILHELTHIPAEGFDRESKEYKKVIKHDIEDFIHLIKEYGVELEKADKLVELMGQ